MRLTRIKKTVEMTKKSTEIKIHVFLVFVALLTSTPGVYVGVNVRSELMSILGATTPSPFAGTAPFGGTSVFCLFLLEASERNVGRAMARDWL